MYEDDDDDDPLLETLKINNNNHRSPDDKPRHKRRKGPPKVTVSWLDADVVKLIKAVEEFPCLWDARYSDNKDLAKRTEAWQTIARKVFKRSISEEQLRVNLLLKLYRLLINK